MTMMMIYYDQYYSAVTLISDSMSIVGLGILMQYLKLGFKTIEAAQRI